ncbi:MAG TPA: ABC transporter substrate-binding protein [Candidatus Andersenbacteria bacterium]|nr:ABC transporter substrate-binding protein [Candidatus Andersenbacteria bacterium]
MNNRQKIWFIIGALIIVGCVWWFGNPNQPVTSDKPKIGGLFALTGFASFAGEASRDGFLMAIEDSGMEVEYVIEDFQSDLKTTATAATKLITVDKVPVIIGPEWNEFGEIITPISATYKTVFISPWMSSEGKIFSSDYYFSGTPSERGQTKKLLQYIQSQGHQKIALLYSNNAWAQGYVNILKDELQKTQVTIVEELKVNENVSDFKTELTRIKQSEPDAIYTVISTDIDEGLFNKQARELNIALPHYMPFPRAESGVFLEQFGSYVKGIIYPAPAEYKNAEKFREKYTKRFGKAPGAISAAVSYDMTTLVLRAMQEGARTSDDIRQYLLRVENYDGYSNSITFAGQRQAAEEKVLIKEITGSTPKVIGE